MTKKNKKQLGLLLGIALGIIYFQVIVGGITRLTESGLSMTDWKVVMGTIPPITETQWNTEFEAYQQSPQYQELNKGMSLSDFKFIFFWEWFHRVWGRIGFLFLLGVFAFFLMRKKLDKQGIFRFGILLFLYICQGLLGWFMVKSGLVDRPEVSHYRLTAHLLLAIFLFAYILWWVADLFIDQSQKVVQTQVQRLGWFVASVLIVQITFGAFMSGLEAATHYPTFPDMNGELIPSTLFAMQPFWLNFLEHIPTIQFTHRGIAYLLIVLILVFWYKARKISTDNTLYIKAVRFLPFILGTQFLLGVLVLLNSKINIPVGWGSAHQAIGLLLLSIMLFILFQHKTER